MAVDQIVTFNISLRRGFYLAFAVVRLLLYIGVPKEWVGSQFIRRFAKIEISND